MSKDNKLFKEISDNVFSLPLFDTHEHLISEEERRKKELDLFMLFSQYTSTDLVSSGMNSNNCESLLNTKIDLNKRWNYFSNYWSNIKNTSYSKVIMEAVRDLYNFDDIDENNYIELSEEIKNTKNINWYDFVIKEKSNIKVILNDLETIENTKIKIVDRVDFNPVMNFDDIISISSVEDINILENEYNLSIYKLNHFLDLINLIFDRIIKKGYKAIKIGIAYRRSLKFREISFSEAERSFLEFYNIKSYSDSVKTDFLSKEELKPFQDYLTHYIIETAVSNHLPIQIHTGFLEGNRNDITNSNPCFLTNLFMKYRRGIFDIFHAGYPFTDELISICKMFQNVYFNLCWIPEVSPSLYKNILNILIEIIPSNKIFGFGGDYLFVEGTYSSQKLTRKLISEVLYKKIKENYFNFDDGMNFAKKILYLNPKSIYRL